jgi:hypothetical protein
MSRTYLNLFAKLADHLWGGARGLFRIARQIQMLPRNCVAVGPFRVIPPLSESFSPSVFGVGKLPGRLSEV